jgi:hypothetical protein
VTGRGPCSGGEVAARPAGEAAVQAESRPGGIEERERET